LADPPGGGLDQTANLLGALSLVITDRTVAAHIEHILNKLGFVSCTQIGVWAAEHGMVQSSTA